jgi:hypothetical protein
MITLFLIFSYQYKITVFSIPLWCFSVNAHVSWHENGHLSISVFILFILRIATALTRKANDFLTETDSITFLHSSQHFLTTDRTTFFGKLIVFHTCVWKSLLGRKFISTQFIYIDLKSSGKWLNLNSSGFNSEPRSLNLVIHSLSTAKA